MTINALAAAGDVLIALVLCTMLQRSRTGFRRTDTMINKLMLFTINTGLLTSLCAVASLISIVAAPSTFIYIAFYFTLGRLYSNSLMATLNARKSIRGEDPEAITLSFRGMHKTGSTTMATAATTNAKCQANNISIKVDTIQEYARDRHGSDHELFHVKEGSRDEKTLTI